MDDGFVVVGARVDRGCALAAHASRAGEAALSGTGSGSKWRRDLQSPLLSCSGASNSFSAKIVPCEFVLTGPRVSDGTTPVRGLHV